MRYKFRAKREDNGQWVYGSLSNFDEQSGYVYILEPFIQASTLPVFTLMKENLHLVDKRTVGQYTGLKDKNGVEIYEGDIVRTYILNADKYLEDRTREYDEFIGAITWNEKYLEYYIQKNSNEYEDVLKPFERHYEVIGNIYEDKELVND